MYFKLTQEIDGEHFGRPKDSPMVFEYENPKVNVCIKKEQRENNEAIIIETRITKCLKKNNKKIFVRLKDGFYSNDENTKELVRELREKSSRENNGLYDINLPYDLLPESFNSYCQGIRNDLFSFSSRTYKTIRWAANIEGSNHPYKNTKLQWSFDNTEWNDFPSKLSGEVRIKHGRYSSPELMEFVTSIVQSGGSEPLAQELLREADSIMSSYPRSALLIAVSAAESAIKQCIIYFQPDTRWLIENTASPDIITLFRDYIHNILLKKSGRGDLSIPKSTILDPLKKSIQMRNILVHGGVCNIDSDGLKSSLSVIKNLLLVLDLYSGNEWAARYIDIEVKIEMGIENHI